jgi:glycosyltransferase involved in cell wall biosynthesis
VSRVLFLTWDGPEQTYLESLFLPIFARLRSAGFSFHVVQMTWAGRDVTAGTAEAASKHDVPYTSLPVVRRPVTPGTVVSALAGSVYVANYLRRHGIDVLMPRSIIPAAVALLITKRSRHVRFVFDADGLSADERVDFSGWSPRRPVYRIYRDVEAQAVRTASAVITRTHAAKRILLDRAGAGTDPEKIFVVPNAKDETAFSPATSQLRRDTRERCGIPDGAPWLVFAGSVGPQYHLPEAFRLFKHVLERRPDARMDVLTGHVAAANELLNEARLPASSVRVGRVPPTDMPAYLAASDLGLAFRAPAFSQQAVSPIKIAEYLLCGLPVVATRGVGDIDEQVSGDVGFSVRGLASEDLARVADWLVTEVLPRRDEFRLRCREVGLRLFGLSTCAARYAEALSREA